MVGLDCGVSVAVEEFIFTADAGLADVPGVAWLPVATPQRPAVVLLGHGGSGTKQSPRNQRLGHWLASQGLAALAIDGPFHGERVDQPLAFAQ